MTKEVKEFELSDLTCAQIRNILKASVRYYICSLLRFIGFYSYLDQLKIACMCEPPSFFLKNGIMIAHAYGITLSADRIGCDVNIGQNVTIGTNGRDIGLGEGTTGRKPKIGNLVRIYPGAIISGDIRIADCVVVAAGAIVTKDIPSQSVVYGLNSIKPLESYHYDYLRQMLYHCDRQYIKVPGLCLIDRRMYVDVGYLKKRQELISNLHSEHFERAARNLFGEE